LTGADIATMQRMGPVLLGLLLAIAMSVAADEGGGISAEGFPSAKPRSGVALLITGAAARIPQEAALIQALDQRGLLKDLVFVSGVSSGALNAVALNAIRSGKMTWARYREILSSMRNEDVFIQAGKTLPVDTSPFRTMLLRVVEGEMGFGRIGDLPLPTAITITRLSDLGLEKTAFRMGSVPINGESDPSLSLVDILMATTAFPVVFPAARIPGAVTIPDTEYVDGGAGEDNVPFEALLAFEKWRGQGVQRVYIVSRKNDAVPELSEELHALGVNDHGVFDRLGLSFDALASRWLLRHLKAFAKQAPDLVSRAFVWTPDFPENFLLFDFDDLEAQYAATEAWAALTEPVPLKEFLAEPKPIPLPVGAMTQYP